MKNKMLQDRILVREIEKSKNVGRVLYNDKEQGSLFGEVLLVGPGKDKIPMTLKPGDTIIFGQYSGIKVKVEIDGKIEELTTMKEDDVFMITNIK